MSRHNLQFRFHYRLMVAQPPRAHRTRVVAFPYRPRIDNFLHQMAPTTNLLMASLNVQSDDAVRSLNSYVYKARWDFYFHKRQVRRLHTYYDAHFTCHNYFTWQILFLLISKQADMIYDYLRLVIKRSSNVNFFSRISKQTHINQLRMKGLTSETKAVRQRLPQILDNCERAAKWRLKWNRPVGEQKCANDVQTSLERAFPHCVRVFKARKKALRNTTRRTKRRLAE